MRKNVAGQVVCAQLNSRADGSPITSGATTCYVLGDGGTQAVGSVGSGLCTHEGNGVFSYAPSQAETDYDHVAFTFVNVNAVVATIQVYTDGVWKRIIEGAYTAEDIMRILAGIAAGKTNIVDNGGGSATVTFRDVSDSGDIVEANMQGSERQSVAVTP